MSHTETLRISWNCHHVPVRLVALAFSLYREKTMNAWITNRIRANECSNRKFYSFLASGGVGREINVCATIYGINLPTIALVEPNALKFGSKEKTASFTIVKTKRGLSLLPVAEGKVMPEALFMEKVVDAYLELLDRTDDPNKALNKLIEELRKAIYDKSRLIKLDAQEIPRAYVLVRRLQRIARGPVTKDLIMLAFSRFIHGLVEADPVLLEFLERDVVSVSVSGRIDLLVVRNGTVYVIELKAGATLYEIAQLGLYAEIVRVLARGYEIVPVLAHIDGDEIVLYRLKSLDFLSKPPGDEKNLVTPFDEERLKELIKDV